MNKVVVLGGGNGQSTLLKGLKLFPLDLTAVVTVADDGKSSGKLREEFNIPAVGDIRRVLISLSETEEVTKKLFDYRFKTNSDLNGHAVGNIILTALIDIYGNISEAVSEIGKILNLKGNVYPLTNDNAILMGRMCNGDIVEGQHNIAETSLKIEEVYYKEEPKINKNVIKSIKCSDLIVLSMGSLYTSIIPNLLSDDIIKAIDESSAKIMYICNIMTQPGETDDFNVSDHINVLNSYLGKKKIDVVMVNTEKVSKRIINSYRTKEQKDIVYFDKENIDIDIISKPLLLIDDGYIRHDTVKVGLEILNYLIK